MIILGIETSCDETSASIFKGKNNKYELLSIVTASQIATHRKYGGVVPEVAARQHVSAILPVISDAIKRAKITQKNIDAIAVTSGPGLITSLRVGVQTAKTLSLCWNKRLMGINHIEGHIYANWLAHPEIELPALCLVVSGGHTEIILIKKHDNYSLIGQTLDDAAGEAFDKVAKLLDIGYPGGPKIQALAKTGNPRAFKFPRPMLNSKNYNFSFSGLKTSVLYLVKKDLAGKKLPLSDLCASFQQAVVDVLVIKTIRAAQQYGVKSVLLAGGVAANQSLRNTLETSVKNNLKPTKFFLPPPSLCTDNASMIAMAGFFHAQQNHYSDWRTLEPDPNWELV